jgi:hypothetical protein
MCVASTDVKGQREGGMAVSYCSSGVLIARPLDLMGDSCDWTGWSVRLSMMTGLCWKMQRKILARQDRMHMSSGVSLETKGHGTSGVDIYMAEMRIPTSVGTCTNSSGSKNNNNNNRSALQQYRAKHKFGWCLQCP